MIIFGWRASAYRVAMLMLLCQICRNTVAHPLDKLVKKFTLFFIPIFPFSTQYRLTCTACGVSQHVTKDMAEQLMQHKIAPAAPAVTPGDRQ